MKIGYALCGSFCTHQRSLDIYESLAKEHELVPIVSGAVYSTDTRFGKAEDLIRRLQTLSGREVIHTVREAEPLGPKERLDMLIIAPCTGNTLAKIAGGITDTSVTMAAKATARQNIPIVIALASNDALSANLCNIGTVLGRKNFYFVPMQQDDILKKPHSLVCDFGTLVPTVEKARAGQQLQPIFLPAKSL